MNPPQYDGKHTLFRSLYFTGAYLRLSWGQEYLLGNDP